LKPSLVRLKSMSELSQFALQSEPDGKIRDDVNCGSDFAQDTLDSIRLSYIQCDHSELRKLWCLAQHHNRENHNLLRSSNHNSASCAKKLPAEKTMSRTARSLSHGFSSGDEPAFSRSDNVTKCVPLSSENSSSLSRHGEPPQTVRSQAFLIFPVLKKT
jgi:hypothetical protein